ncbi:MAG: LLM class flavin-dependent oxidoreductase, partial [Deltaproteobacteria bacterium]
ATIDVISNGRLTLGIGIGVRENDYLATGLDFHRRGRRIEEQLPLLRRLWAGEPLSNEVGPIGPQSPRPGGPELLIGGYVPAIVQRIAKWGDGYMAPGGGETPSHAQDVATDPPSMASQRAQRPAALGRRQLLRPGTERARSRHALYQSQLWLQSGARGKTIEYVTGLARGGGGIDQAPSRHGCGRIHIASVRGGFGSDGAFGGSRGEIQLSTPDHAFAYFLPSPSMKPLSSRRRANDGSKIATGSVCFACGYCSDRMSKPLLMTCNDGIGLCSISPTVS